MRRELAVDGPRAVFWCLWLVGLGVVLSALPLIGCQTAPAEPAPNPPASGVALWAPVPRNVDAESLKGSVHAQLDCSDCHAPAPPGAATKQEQFPADRTRCEHCHQAAADAYRHNVHGHARQAGRGEPARCVHCHGAHDIVPVSDLRSPVNKRQLPITCSRCHQHPEQPPRHFAPAGMLMYQYAESIHRRALVAEGLMVAPSCADCHGLQHRMLEPEDPKSTVFRANVPGTCGKCHQGVEEAYRRSKHGQLLAQGNHEVPVCIDCHSAHSIERASPHTKLESHRMCGHCHEKQLKRYLQTYHGRALDLGRGEMASCYDCHDHHEVLPVSDPNSTLSSTHRVQTCQKCHPGTGESFAMFQAHGDYTDRQDYPILFWTFAIMTSLIVGTFAVWGIHTLLWFVRMLLEWKADPKRFRAEKEHALHEVPGQIFVRFSPVDRFTHALVIISFLTLVATGMPLKFHDSAWAQVVFQLLGGAKTAATLHRIGAVLSLLYLVIHVSRILHAAVRNRHSFRTAEGRFSPRLLLGYMFGPESPLPNFQDVRDVLAHTKYFFGRGPRPSFDRFSYWEKFDYLAEFWGSAFIGLSGLVMWFPKEVTQVAPGWFINVAHVIHSQEALLAAGFILTFHFFNAHFRTEKFPLDRVIFSGRITEAELLHERRRQYDRLVEKGELDAIRLRDEWPRARWIYNSLGLLVLYAGLLLSLAVFWSFFRRLWGAG